MNFDFLNRGAMLAPMAGVTDMPFRVLCHEMGCPMAVSEMVSAKGYLLAPKDNRATSANAARWPCSFSATSRKSWRERRRN